MSKPAKSTPAAHSPVRAYWSVYELTHRTPGARRAAGLRSTNTGPAHAGSRLKLTDEPYWGKPAVRNDRGDRGDVGIIRSPVRASILPDCGGCPVMAIPTAIPCAAEKIRVDQSVRPFLA